MRKYVFILLLGLIWMSCEKSEEIQIDENLPVTIEINPIQNRSSTLRNSVSMNPFNVNVMKQAYLNVKSQGVLKNEYKIGADKLYVRFLPSNEDEMDLLKSLDLDLFSYPLDQDFSSEGEGGHEVDSSYHDPKISSDDFTWQYTVIGTDYIPPSVPIEVLDTLFINDI